VKVLSDKLMMQRRFSNLELTYECESDFDEPDRYRDLLGIRGDRKLIAQGAGLSYAPASFGKNSKTISMRKFDRILKFSPEIETIEVEAGITLKKLFNFLTLQGFYLLIQPGWPDLCVGALIASNAHGKNQFVDGIFSQITESLTIFHPDKGVISCSRSKNSDIFELTCGGLGLTGIILTACLKIAKLNGNLVRREIIPVRNLVETIEVLTERRDKHDIVMSWTNFSEPNSNFGKGFIITSEFFGCEGTGHSLKYHSLDPHRSRKFRVPVFKKHTITLINKLYYLIETRKKVTSNISLFSALFPFYNKAFYFDLFGKRGFIAHQILIPEDRIFEFLSEFKSIFWSAQIPIVLSAFKAFRGDQKLLYFDGNGFSLYTDFINNSDSRAFLDRLIDLSTDYGCITNIMRNSFLSAKAVRAQYPEFEMFANRVHHFDPKRIFTSALTERLEL